jgi:heme/copper-type cytochrome/quinol oxidase subunit 4
VFQYQVVEKFKLQPVEVLKTYIYGWFVAPLLLFGPLILCVKQVALSLGLPLSLYETDKGTTALFNICITAGILNLVVMVLLWSRWDEARGLPKNYKELLKN